MADLSNAVPMDETLVTKACPRPRKITDAVRLLYTREEV
jgi:hypothetical protein